LRRPSLIKALMSEFMAGVPPFVPLRRHSAASGYEGRAPATRQSPCLAGRLSDARAVGERSARRGQRHHILRHPEAGGVTQVVPADATHRDDGKPLGSRLEDEPRELHRGKSCVDLTGHADLAQAPETDAEWGEGLPEHRDGSREEIEK